MNLNISIKVSLARQGKTQKWLCEQMGVTNNVVTKICKQNKAGTKRLRIICDVLGISLSEFIAIGEQA